MIGKNFSFCVLSLLALFLMSMIEASCLYASGLSSSTSAASAPPQSVTDVRGTWSGTLFSNHSDVASFTMTVVINQDAQGHLIGASTLNSHCLTSARLEVTVTGSEVVLAGSDQSGNSLTVRGTVDKTGTLLNASYVLNGSASGKCEIDDGTGTMAKR